VIETILVFDLGGTQLRAGLFSTAGKRLTAVVRASSDVVRGEGDYLPRLTAALLRLASELGGPTPEPRVSTPKSR
jgi:sugar (pentulose or hexulose) kinase